MQSLSIKLLLSFTILCLYCSGQIVGGYFPNYNYTATNYLNIQYNKLTHLYYFSLNPTGSGTGTSNGSLWFNDSFSWFTTNNFVNVINRARTVNPNIKILIATGGAPGNDTDLNARLQAIGSNNNINTTFCNNIIRFIKQYNINGWDLDWEFPNTVAARTAHQNILTKMRSKIDSLEQAECKPYELSIAVGGGYFDKVCFNPAHVDYVNAAVIDLVDHVNIMTYDAPTTGSASCRFASHQDYTMMTRSFNAWIANKNWPANKISLGIGFYDNNGTNFRSGGNNATFYNQNYWGSGGSGCPNIQQKIDFIRTNGAAGIFTWELTQDNLCAGTVPACYSLLDCMFQYTQSSWGPWPLPSNPCPVVTPIQLSSFEVNDYENTAIITWSTAMEESNSFFELQASQDGKNFSYEATISGQGSKSIKTDYVHYDNKPNNYYRLKAVSNNGEVEYSKIIRSNSSPMTIQYSPNPFTNELNINFYNKDDEELETKIYNQLGVEAESFIIKGELSQISVGQKLQPGSYVIKITSRYTTKTFVVQKL